MVELCIVRRADLIKQQEARSSQIQSLSQVCYQLVGTAIFLVEITVALKIICSFFFVTFTCLSDMHLGWILFNVKEKERYVVDLNSLMKS